MRIGGRGLGSIGVGPSHSWREYDEEECPGTNGRECHNMKRVTSALCTSCAQQARRDRKRRAKELARWAARKLVDGNLTIDAGELEPAEFAEAIGEALRR